MYLAALSYQPSLAVSNEGRSNDIQNFTQSLVRSASAVSSFEVRAGYFGLCVTSASNKIDWICAADAASLMPYSTPEADPLGVLDMARKVKDEIVFPGFL